MQHNSLTLHNCRSVDDAIVLLDTKADPNERNRDGQTPLFHAYNTDIAQCLIQYNALIDIKDNKGQSPLHTLHDDKVVLYLLELKISPYACDYNGKTPLHITNNIDIARLLLQFNATVDDIDIYYNTPLHTTLYYNISELLINNNASIDYLNYYKQTPLYKTCNIDIAKLLLQYDASPFIEYNNTNNKCISSDVAEVIFNAQVEFMSSNDILHSPRNTTITTTTSTTTTTNNNNNTLLTSQQHPQGRYQRQINDDDNNIIYDITPFSGNQNILRYLITHNILYTSINILYKESLLFYKPNYNNIKLLLHINPKSVYDMDIHNRIPLHYVTNICDTQILLDYKSDPNQYDDDNVTPTMMSSNIDILRLLIQYNGNPCLLSLDSRNILWYAQDRDTVEFVINEYTINPKHVDISGKTPLYDKCPPDVVESLIEYNVNVNHLCQRGKSPLHYISRIDSMHSLIKYNADVNMYTTLHPYTPIMSQKCGNKGVELLLDHNAAITIPSINPNGALYDILSNVYDISPPLLHRLISLKGNVTAVSQQGNIPPTYKANEQTTAILLSYNADPNAYIINEKISCVLSGCPPASIGYLSAILDTLPNLKSMDKKRHILLELYFMRAVEMNSPCHILQCIYPLLEHGSDPTLISYVSKALITALIARTTIVSPPTIKNKTRTQSTRAKLQNKKMYKVDKLSRIAIKQLRSYVFNNYNTFTLLMDNIVDLYSYFPSP